jgi:SAM-dependent methyltransferase
MKKVEGYPYKRLIFYNRRADQLYWDEHWRSLHIKDSSHATFLKRIICKYFPTTGKLLEAGCGLGQYVKTLTDEGYDVVGIDFSKLAINKAKKFAKKLSLVVGDVLSLPYKDKSFIGCISLGVVEHFEKGSEAAIKEMYRVLDKKGILLISVPFFNPIRQIKAHMGFYQKQNKNRSKGEFYQYAFTLDEFEMILKRCGFVPLKIIKYDAISGLNSEILNLTKIVYYFERRYLQVKNSEKVVEKAKIALRKLISKICNSRMACELAAHMIVVIAKKGCDERFIR